MWTRSTEPEGLASSSPQPGIPVIQPGTPSSPDGGPQPVRPPSLRQSQTQRGACWLPAARAASRPPGPLTLRGRRSRPQRSGLTPSPHALPSEPLAQQAAHLQSPEGPAQHQLRMWGHAWPMATIRPGCSAWTPFLCPTGPLPRVPTSLRGTACCSPPCPGQSWRSPHGRGAPPPEASGVIRTMYGDQPGPDTGRAPTNVHGN